MAIESVCITWKDEKGAHTLELGESGQESASPRRRPAPPQGGKPWTAEQEQRVREGFGGVEDAGELATELGRTRGAVLARAVKLGLLSLEAAGLRYPPGGSGVTRDG